MRLTAASLVGRAALALVPVLLAGCVLRGPSSALDPAGPQAEHIRGLWLVYFWVCTAVYVLVVGALVLAVVRRNPAPDRQHLPAPDHRRVVRVIVASVAATVLLLGWFFAATLATESRLGALATPNPLTVNVTGRQWWWDITYDSAEPSHQVRTANEIHIPVGRPVLLRLASGDVIHSLWVPRLQGKRDLIPGRENQLWIQADEPGEFSGQCAEFCGHQHAHMRLLVVAQPPAEFEAWLAHQRTPAPEPEDAQARQGRDVFENATCIMCHTVRGTRALSRVGPDLTHLASRKTLGAATLPNNRGNLAGWVLDPQSIKPGSRMPPHTFPPEDFRALLAYLESLQ